MYIFYNCYKLLINNNLFLSHPGTFLFLNKSISQTCTHLNCPVNVCEYERHLTLKSMQSASSTLEEPLASSRQSCPLKENTFLPNHQSSVFHVLGLYEPKQLTILHQGSVDPFSVYEVHSCLFLTAIPLYEYSTICRINCIMEFQKFIYEVLDCLEFQTIVNNSYMNIHVHSFSRHIHLFLCSPYCTQHRITGDCVPLSLALGKTAKQFPMVFVPVYTHTLFYNSEEE